MLNLSMKTTWDARSMRTITIMALAYLPPTFVAVSNFTIRVETLSFPINIALTTRASLG